MSTRSSLTYLFLSLLFWGVTPELTAQNDNPVISIQGTLKDANGSSVADGEQELIFRLYDQPANGAALWTETAPVNVVGGIYSHNLGSVEPLNESNFDRKLYLGITVSGLELFPRTELTYAPYALSVATAQRIARGACSGQVGDVKYSILKPTDFAMENGECWVPMDGREIPGTKLAGYGIANVPDLSGLFMRATEYNDGNDPDRTPDSPVATLQDDRLPAHSHGMNNAGAHAHSYGDSYLSNIDVDDQNETSAIRDPSGIYDLPRSGAMSYRGDPNVRFMQYENDGRDRAQYINTVSSQSTNNTGSHAHNIQSSGTGTESRPKNLNFYAYIRVD